MFAGFTEAELGPKATKRAPRPTKGRGSARQHSKVTEARGITDTTSENPQESVPVEAMLAPPKQKEPDLIPDNEANRAETEMTNNVSEAEASTSGANNDREEPISAPVEEAKPQPDDRSRIDILTEKQKQMEKENKKKKELLAKAIAERKKQTTEESKKLQELQSELNQIELGLTSDVKILRKAIEEASFTMMEAKKRYDRAEKEFVSAKLHLHQSEDRKDLLTEHLCSIIQKTEERKAEKLEKLMKELNINSEGAPS